MKRATTTTKTKVAKVRVKLKTICTAEINASATLPRTAPMKWQTQHSIRTMSCMADQ